MSKANKVDNPLSYLMRRTAWKDAIDYLRGQDIPVEELRTYGQLQQYHGDFCAGKEPFLIIVGQRGVGKSVMFENVPGSAYVAAKSTARATYEWAYDHSAESGNFKQDQKLIIDDVDRLLRADDSVALLKTLGASVSPKRICYNAKNLGSYPREFHTASQICLIFNRLPDIRDDNVQAVLDRGLTLYFFPTPAEVHRYVGSFWLKSDLHKKIYGFVGRQIEAGAITRLSIRAVYGAMLKDAQNGRDWQTLYLKRMNGYDKLFSRIHSLIKSGLPVERQCAEFCREFTVSRATFFNWKREFLDAFDLP